MAALKVQLVRPSGDLTGATDRAAIQAAITAYETAGYFADPGMVVLSGSYYIDQPLTGGSATGYAICLAGAPKGYIKYVGNASTSYMLSMNGYYGRGWLPVVSDITFDCDWKIRGVLLRGLVHQQLLERVYIRRPVEVGVDAISCWGSVISRSTVNEAIGIGLRTYDFNTGRLDQFGVRGYGCYHSAGVTNAATTTLWEYEITNGKAAAEAHYGADYIDKWPATDDTSVTTIGSVAVQTLADERAGVILHGRSIDVSGGTFENSRYCEYPNIYIWGGGPDPQPRGDSGMLCIRDVWMESAANRLSRIAYQGDEYEQNTVHKAVTIQRVYARDYARASGSCRAFLELRGKTENVRVIDCCQQPGGTAIIYAADGEHVDPYVESPISYSPTIAQSSWIAADVGATVSYSSKAVQLAVFADAAARDLAWATPVAGWSCFLTDPGVMSVYSGAAWVSMTAASP